MIFITGDVHSNKLKTWEQKKIGSEIKASKKYLDILKKYGLNCTLFVNGISLDNKNESQEINELLEYDIQLGGHTYDNFGKMNIIKSYIYRRIYGCIYGSSEFQKKDIKKTKEAFEKKGLKMSSWRTHAFGSNRKTFEILQKEGVLYISDLLGDKKPFESGGMIHLPINIPVDQNTIIYGELRPENRDPFASCTKGRIKVEEWFEILKKRVKENEKNKVPSIILIHPATMAYLDDFELFEKVAKFLSKYKSKKISELNEKGLGK
ncbi:MAG: polysaccharide deacetylase family protein [archaeon]